MCPDPVSAAIVSGLITAAVTATTSAVTAGVQASQQRAQARQQDMYKRQVFEQNRLASIKALSNAQERAAVLNDREQRNLGVQTDASRTQALRQQGQAEAYAATTGMQGLSTELLFQDFDRSIAGVNTQFVDSSKAIQFNTQQTLKQYAEAANSQANGVAQGVVDFSPGVGSQMLMAGLGGAVSGAAKGVTAGLSAGATAPVTNTPLGGVDNGPAPIPKLPKRGS